MNTRTEPLRSPLVVATLGVAGISWIASIQQMRGMDMGTATELGPFGSFVGLWVPMMAAMMLPGALPAIASSARRGTFVVVYLAVWTLVGLVVYPLYAPHGTTAAGVLTIIAGAYELTPLKRFCRRRCRAPGTSGLEYGLCCVGSSAGLMLMLLALGVMSITWMAIVAALVFAQKLLAPRAAIDVPLALAIIALGLVVLV
jgi:predicted metal-binding membrane protein